MIKKILILTGIFIILMSAGISYFNRVYLPVKIKSLIIKALQEQTQKKVTLGSLQFNIFKGLVLKNLAIADAEKTIISVEEASCSFLIWPFFKKQIIIPGIDIKSAKVFLERRADNTFNLSDLFFPKPAQKASAKPQGVLIYKIHLSRSRIDFQDSYFTPAFTKSVDNINLVLNLSLPAAVKFNLKAEIPTQALPIKISATGQYKIREKQLLSKVNIEDLSPKEFPNYYQNFGIFLAQGLIDARIDISLKNNLLNADLDAESKGLKFLAGLAGCMVKGDIKAHFKYDLKSKLLNYSGKLNLLSSDISGLPDIGTIKNISGTFNFDNSAVSADKLNADLWGIPVEAKLKLVDFKKPLLDIKLLASPDLNSLKNILSDKFKITFPAEVKGNSRLALDYQGRIFSKELPQINGKLDISDASLKFEKIKHPFEAINGRLILSLTQLNWENLIFKYSGVDYRSSGVLNNFQSPAIKLGLDSSDLSLQSIFALNGKLIDIREFSGKYFNSDFSLAGNASFADSSAVQAEINGILNVDLEDLEKYLKQQKDQLVKIKPQGKVQVKLALSGNLNNIKSCRVKANLSSPALSAYGLKSSDFLMEYIQLDSLLDIPVLRLSLYDGTLDAAAKVNLDSANLAFWVEANIQNVKLERLKLDTPAKGQDISGAIQAQAKFSGFFGDLSKLSGQGQILVSEGKLWQLNFFKGIGKLIFISDFTNVVCHQGGCSVSVADK